MDVLLPTLPDNIFILKNVDFYKIDDRMECVLPCLVKTLLCCSVHLWGSLIIINVYLNSASDVKKSRTGCDTIYVRV